MLITIVHGLRLQCVLLVLMLPGCFVSSKIECVNVVDTRLNLPKSAKSYDQIESSEQKEWLNEMFLRINFNHCADTDLSVWNRAKVYCKFSQCSNSKCRIFFHVFHNKNKNTKKGADSNTPSKFLTLFPRANTQCSCLFFSVNSFYSSIGWCVFGRAKERQLPNALKKRKEDRARGTLW